VLEHDGQNGSYSGPEVRFWKVLAGQVLVSRKTGQVQSYYFTWAICAFIGTCPASCPTSLT
jgi:hypothetical protein